MERLSPLNVAPFLISAPEESEPLVNVNSRAHRPVAKRKFSEGTEEQFIRMLKRPCWDHIGMELSSPTKANSPSSHSEDCKLSQKLASLTCSLEERLEFTEQRNGKRKYTRDTGEQLRSSKRRCRDHTGTSGSSEDNNNDDNKSAVPTEQINKRWSLSTSENIELQHPNTYTSTSQTERPKLVLDLDHTLLNTTEIFDISLDEVYLIDLVSPLKVNGLLHRIDFEDGCRMVKLRPFVHEFLQEVNKMFELYIYTMGSGTYAREVVKRIDPENRYFFFPVNVISRTDYSRRQQKSLRVVPASRTRTVIVDDKSCVWKEEDRENIIEIERYNYFSSSCRACNSTCKSLAELRTDESSADGNLAAILSVLKCAYEKFEMDQQRGVQPDFRRILKDTSKVRQEIKSIDATKFVHHR